MPSQTKKNIQKILITGGSGFIGEYLCKKLQEKNYQISILTRQKNYDSKKKGIKYYYWDVEKEKIEKNALLEADAIINLVGANVSDKRWTQKRKKIILQSRTKTTEFLFNAIKKYNHYPKVVLSASATGYYGSTISNQIFKEKDSPSNDFLASVCRQWEQSVNLFETLGIRTVKFRTGIVLSKKGGALEKMLIPVKLNLATAIGCGNQYLPWIHIDDLCNAYIQSIEDTKIKGVYNLVAPEHKINREFIQLMAFVFNKAFWKIKIPNIIFKILLGEMSQMLLTGSRISAEKIILAGIKFKFPTLEKALMDIKNKKTSD